MPIDPYGRDPDHAESPQRKNRSEGTQRQASIDVYRGLVMFLMLAEVLRLNELVDYFPDSGWAVWLSFHTSHVAWTGCSLHDMIQPSFSFLVGVSLPFSLAARQQRGQSFRTMLAHAVWRSCLLILLGIFLRSLGRPSTNFFFVDTLTQIGLGYVALFLLARLSTWVQWLSVGAVLLGYWALFACWTVQPPSLEAVGVPADWPHQATGFAAHWNKNANPAWLFDSWFMNLFPQDPPFVANAGGYCVLNFVPTLATMLLGVIAGGLLKNSTSWRTTLVQLLVLGGLMLALGWALGHFGVCPVVKRIWTPSWVLFSGGICFLTLGVLFAVCDVWQRVSWAWPLLVIGANSIVAYVMSWTLEEPIHACLIRHFGTGPFAILGPAWQTVLSGAAILLVMWLILLWLFRKRIFVRI